MKSVSVFNFNFLLPTLVLLAALIVTFRQGSRPTTVHYSRNSPVGAQGPQGPTGAIGAIGVMIETIYNILFTVPRDHLKLYIDKLHQSLTSFHPLSYIESEKVSYHDRTADFTVRVPSRNVTGFIDFAGKLIPGTIVRKSNVERHDHSDEYRDLNAEIAALKDSHQRLVELSTKRADTKIADFLLVEKRIDGIAREMRKLQERVKDLKKRTLMASVTFTVKEETRAVTVPSSVWKLMTPGAEIWYFILQVAMTCVVLSPVIGGAMWAGNKVFGQ